jgi:hypothetical protein
VSRKAMLIGASALIAVVVLVGAFSILTATGSQEIEGQGAVEDTQFDEVFAAGEKEMGDLATRENATMPDDAKCFLSKASESAEASNDFIRCGPVLFIDSPSRDDRWMSAELYVYSGDEVDGATADELVGIGPLQRDTRLSDGEVLYRPDGAEPNLDELDYPDPAPVASDFAEVVESQVGVDLEPVEQGLVGLGFEMDIEGYALVERLGEGPEALVAPDGSELLVVRYEWSPPEQYRGDPAFAVSVDGTNRTIQLPQGPATLVAAVPADAEDLGINAAEETLDQTLSLTTGERSGDTPEILYRDPASRSVAVNSTVQIPLNVVSTGSYPREYTSVQTQIVLGSAELVWAPSDSELSAYDASDAAPSSRDKASLVLEVRQFGNVAEGSAPNRPELAASMIVLQVGDERINPTTGLDRQGALVFEVPADLTEAKLVITPGDNVLPSAGDYVLNYGQATGEAAIRFPEG